MTRLLIEADAAGYWPHIHAIGAHAIDTLPTLFERVDVETALRPYTVNNAWAEGMEDEKGRIRKGMLADLVVLDANPLEVESEALQAIEVVLTLVDGRVIFEWQDSLPPLQTEGD